MVGRMSRLRDLAGRAIRAVGPDHGEIRYVWVRGDYRATFKFRETPGGRVDMTLAVESPHGNLNIDL